MYRNPFGRNRFDLDACSLMRWADRGPLREALVAVPLDTHRALACRVIVPTGDGPEDWLERAAVTATVIVHAFRVRLAAEDTTPE